jgi:hypothetical protein
MGKRTLKDASTSSLTTASPMTVFVVEDDFVSPGGGNPRHCRIKRGTNSKNDASIDAISMSTIPNATSVSREGGGGEGGGGGRVMGATAVPFLFWSVAR